MRKWRWPTRADAPIGCQSRRSGKVNARETLQALLDGETIIGDNGYLWKLDEYDELVYRKPKKEKKWVSSYLVFNGDCEIYTECTLTFEEAIIEMLKGRTVMREDCEEYAYRLHDDRFESACSDDEFTEWGPCEIPEQVRASKWKVIE